MWSRFGTMLGALFLAYLLYVLFDVIARRLNRQIISLPPLLRKSAGEFFRTALVSLVASFIFWFVFVQGDQTRRKNFHSVARPAEENVYATNGVTLEFIRNGSDVLVKAPMIRGARENVTNYWTSDGHPILGLRRYSSVDTSLIDAQNITGAFLDNRIDYAEFRLPQEAVVGVFLSLNPKVIMDSEEVRERHALLGELPEFYDDSTPQTSWMVRLKEQGNRLFPTRWRRSRD